MILCERIAAKKKELKNKIPVDALEVMRKATWDLEASGVINQSLKARQKAPQFSLLSSDGTVVNSADLLAQGPVVVSFFRGFWCAFCNLELEALEEVHQEIERAGATLVAISPQLPQFLKRGAIEKSLSFPILSDKGNEVAKQFKLVHGVCDDLKTVFRSLGVDLEIYNGDNSWTLPFPATYIIDENGLIRQSEVSADFTIRPDPVHTLHALRAILNDNHHQIHHHDLKLRAG